MKRDFLILLVLSVLAVGTSAWGQCPKDTFDLGICDSVYVEPWPYDTLLPGGGPYTVRIPIYMTHDVVDEAFDSIAGFQIPLCYTHSNPAKYCSVSDYQNKIVLSGASLSRSVFRHLVRAPGDTVHNWMLSLYQQGDEVGEDWGWGNKLLYLNSSSDSAHFWFGLVPTTQPLMGTVSHTLISTMTFKLEDTMTICIDSCFWPVSSRLVFSRNDSKLFVPRFGTPHDTTSPEFYHVCFKLPPTSNDVRDIQGSDEVRPSQFSLSQNYPNPFNPITNFQFTLPKSVHVKIDIFNIVGQKVKTLMDQDMKPGVYQVDWDGKDERGNSVSTGVYFYKVQAGDFSDMKKMVLLK